MKINHVSNAYTETVYRDAHGNWDIMNVHLWPQTLVSSATSQKLSLDFPENNQSSFTGGEAGGRGERKEKKPPLLLFLWCFKDINEPI